jgi:methyl-accepting chemotaxis protein
MRLRPDEVGLVVTAMLIAASITPLGLPTWTSSVLGGLALFGLVSSVVYGRLARRGWQKRQTERYREIERAVRGYDAQTTEVIDESELQFERLRASLGQVSSVIQNATSRLTGSLTGLQAESGSQREMLRELVEELLVLVSSNEQEEQAAGIKKFTEQTERMIDRFVDTVQDLKSSSDQMATTFSNMHAQVDAASQLLNDVNTITAQTDLLALNAAIEAARAGDAGRGFAVVADEVRSLAKRTSQFSAQIRSLLSDIEASITSVNASVEQATNTDLSVASQSKGNVAAMWQEIDTLNRRAGEQSSHIAEISEKIHHLVMEGVVSLQFEDIVSQLIEQIRHRTGMIERYLHGVAEIQRGALQNLEPAEINARLEKLAAHHRGAASEFLNLNDNAVTQDSVNEGNVDLF